MKRCPNCQKTFPDSMRFCQTDGTPLVEEKENVPPPDPYKTVVGGTIKPSDDLLQLPDIDPMKTMVSPASSPKIEPPKIEPPSKPFGDPVPSNPKTEAKTVIAEPGMNPPSFGDLSGGSSSSSSLSGSGSSSSSSSSSPFSNNPPKFGSSDDLTKTADSSPFSSSPFSNEPKQSSSPFDKPSNPPTSSPFDKPLSSPASSPFEKTPPPPYKEPEPFGGAPNYNQAPFGQQNDPFAPQNDPFNQQYQQNDWAPPPAPVSNWQDQGLGSNTPFQPPVATGGQNNTLAIVSLVCGILGVCFCGLLTGIPALITGYMAKNNADTNPAMYGGRGMALAGMILGGVSILVTIVAIIFQIVIRLH